MNDQAAFLARVEAANLSEFAKILRTANPSEEQALIVAFGEGRLRRLQELARANRVRREASPGVPRGNVIVIPGLMGSELTTVDPRGNRDRVWLSYWQVLRGRLERLRLDADGRLELNRGFNAAPTGILKKYYGILMLSLSRRWNVRPFWYDWRKDIDQAADELRLLIRHGFEGGPIHIVAHSMGGLVACAFVKNYPDDWRSMNDRDGNSRGGRLVLLGTPNHGSFLIPQAFTGLAETVASLAWLDHRHDLDGLLQIINSFPGPYQMLPSIRRLPMMRRLYDPAIYGDRRVSPLHLDRADSFHRHLEDAIDPDRMFHVAGYGQPTVTGIRDFDAIGVESSYNVTCAGDGSVPLSLGPARPRRPDRRADLLRQRGTHEADREPGGPRQHRRRAGNRSIPVEGGQLFHPVPQPTPTIPRPRHAPRRPRPGRIPGLAGPSPGQPPPRRLPRRAVADAGGSGPPARSALAGGT